MRSLRETYLFIAQRMEICPWGSLSRSLAVFGGQVALGSILKVHPQRTAGSSPGFQPGSE